MNPLAKVLDPEKLAGARVVTKLRVEVLPAWAGREILVTMPRRLVCATCDGGGCDACGRSGALRLPELDVPRKTSVHLPRSLRDGIALRIARPFDDADIEVLILEVVAADRPSSGCELAKAVAIGRPPNRVVWLIGAAVAVLLLVWLVASRG